MVLSKRYDFWFLFFLLSCGAAFFSYNYLGQVISLVNLSITVDRHQVLEEAKKLATQLNWDISEYQHVVSFDSEEELQCFVELEGGGKQAFIDMFQSGNYYPYHWHVRFFKEKEVEEMHVWFSPEGQVLGFCQKVAEQTEGAALSKEQAQFLVEEQIGIWCPRFERYQLIEYNCEKRDIGRIDHDFTYERTDISLEKGLYRFHAVVCGDVITRFEPSIKVPDNFIRRYQEMRSANTLLASLGLFFFRGLYLLFFALIGLVFLYQRNYLLLKSSAIAALTVAGGMALRGLNDMPLWWVSYNTVQSTSTFLLMKLFGEFISFLFLFALIFFVLVVTEAAGRFIYKHHVQFFQFGNLTVVGSIEALHQVLLGYLLVPFMFLFIVVFGYITKTYYGWWMPAANLSDPNVIASYFPWLGVIALALFAGFFEEVTFRALPFAMTALFTRNSRYKKFWFIAIFIVQALIFGAAHANYPNQPFYARLIELIPVSSIFGLVYLNFGLLPGVITHFVYDAILMGLPVFTSNLIVSQAVLVFLIGLPLWIVIGVYAYNKRVYALPIQYFNQAFYIQEYVPTPVQQRKMGESLPARNRIILGLLGVIGLMVWVMMYKFKPDVDPLLITKSCAIEIARQTIQDKFHVELDETWTASAIAQDDCSCSSTRFIWQVYGPAVYDMAQGSYLSGISWLVRFVRFSGDVEERGEEYAVIISSCHLDRHTARQPLTCHAGHVIKVSHTLPEHFPGADITQEQAEKLAYKFIKQEYGLQRKDIELVSVNSDKFENRRDWVIIVQDVQFFDFPLEGQARIKVILSGDQVTEFSRFIFVPEMWERADQERMMNLQLVKTGLWFLMFVLTIIGCMFGIVRLMTSRVGVEIFRHKALFTSTVAIIYTFNSFSFFIANFTTAQPFYDQLVRICLASVTQISWQVLLSSIFLAVGAVSFVRGAQSNFCQSVLLSLAGAFFMHGVSSLLNFYEPHLEPVVGNYGSVSHWSSMVSFCTGYIKIFYLILSLIIAMFVVLKTLRNWAAHPLLQLAVSILFFIALEAIQLHTSASWMLFHGTGLGIAMYVIYYLFLQYDMTLLSMFFALFVGCMIIPEVLYPSYLGAQKNACVAILFLILAAWFFYERSHQ